MKVLVTYLSLTGNTKKVAETIFNELECQKEIHPIMEINSMEGYDVIFAGFPVWQYEPAGPAARFLHANAKGRNMALFVTHAMPYEMEIHAEQKKLDDMLEKCRQCATGGNLIGFFHCRGELSKTAAGLFSMSEDAGLREFGRSRHYTSGHPEKGELDVARIFARDVMNTLRAGIADPGCF